MVCQESPRPAVDDSRGCGLLMILAVNTLEAEGVSMLAEVGSFCAQRMGPERETARQTGR